MGSLTDAAASGDRLKTLEALRDSLAAEIEAFDGSRAGGTTAALAARMVDVLEQIEALKPPERKGTALDQLADRRRARGAATASVDAPEGSAGSGGRG